MPLETSDLVVDEDVRLAESLPVRAFTDPAVLQLELDTIFSSSWLLVPERSAEELSQDPRTLAELLAPRGARVPATLLGRSVYLQRAWDGGGLAAFPNTCTHAWYPLVLGPSRGPSVTCAQHGRKFDCEGRFISQPGFGAGLPGFPRDCDHLARHEIAEWHGSLFACLGKPEAPLASLLAELYASVARLPLDRLRPEPGSARVRELDGNWKQHAWNYMDKFHVTHVHRAPGGLADALDMRSYATELHGATSLQWAYAADPAAGFDPDQLHERFRDPGGRRVFALWWFVFPNLTLNFYPWGLSINVYGPVVGKPERTSFLWYHHVFDEERYARRDSTWLNDQVDREDVDAMALVRRGLRSGNAPRGRFAPGEEDGPHWFHRRVSQALTAGGAP